MSRKLRSAMIEHANRAVDAMHSCSNEQAVKNYLIDPFLFLLGYDTREPGVVLPEASIQSPRGSSGRVDYVVRTDENYLIAVECKALGSKLRDEWGQLRRYYDDIDRVVVGILTDGIQYHFFASTDMQHRMDSEPFLMLNIKEFIEKDISSGVVNILLNMKRGNFDKNAIEEIAKVNLLEKRLRIWWFQQLKNPSDELCRLALKEQGVSPITKKMIESFRPVITSGFCTALGHDVCERIYKKGGLENFRTSSKEKIEEDPRIITTNREIEVFNHCKIKLAHHTNSVVPFEFIQQLKKKDYVTKFCLYFRQVNKGRILDYYELEGGEEKFEFPNGAVYNDIDKIDDALVDTFIRRVREYEELF